MTKPPSAKLQPNRLKPLSLYPLTPERALEAFMQVNPKRIQVAERKAEQGRKRRSKS